MNNETLYLITLLLLMLWNISTDIMVYKLNKHVNKHCVQLDILLIDYINRNKGKLKGKTKVYIEKVKDDS